jgi:hypothetical protein
VIWHAQRQHQARRCVVECHVDAKCARARCAMPRYVLPYLLLL